MADLDTLVAQLAALTAALAQAQNVQQQQPITTQPQCVLPVFMLNTADPHYTKSWFAQVEMILRLHAHNDNDKVDLVMASLDTSTFSKVRRALLPEDITELHDFAKLKKTMIKLFDVEESLFAQRFAAFQIEWGGPEQESVREYEARIKANMESFEADQFGENEIATLNFVMGMKARALEPLRTIRNGCCFYPHAPRTTSP
uniref:Retrotransposon gag domain-containing protein n=1 Tax=Panagrolaimus superbus TaxID=310955 RepID=A0A914YDF6_9BILA